METSKDERDRGRPSDDAKSFARIEWIARIKTEDERLRSLIHNYAFRKIFGARIYRSTYSYLYILEVKKIYSTNKRLYKTKVRKNTK